MNNLNDYIYKSFNECNTKWCMNNEGFFSNVGAGFDDMKEWFNRLPVCMDQYLTKYDIKHTKKDPKNFTIIFGNTYKRNHDNRNIVVDLKPYITELMKHPVENCALIFQTGLWNDQYGDIKIYSKIYSDDDDALDFDKKIKISIIEYSNPLKLPFNRSDDYICYIRPVTLIDRHQKRLVELDRYADDYPKNRNFSDSENATWWTETLNNLK